MFSLDGKVALVVGGTSGIGKEISLGFAEAGATVIPVSRNIEKVNKTVEEINNKGKSKSTGFALDARDVKDFREMLKKIISVYDKIDILVNAQGITSTHRPAEDFDEEEFDSVISTNLKSVFLCCIEVGKYMLKNGKGSIINIASTAAFRGWSFNVIYSMSKWGVVSLTQTLASEWSSRGVRVNGICPGLFSTEMNVEMKSERKEAMLQRTPMKRTGKLPELLGAAILLASDDSSYITGETIRVDGGYLAIGI